MALAIISLALIVGGSILFAALAVYIDNLGDKIIEKMDEKL